MGTLGRDRGQMGAAEAHRRPPRQGRARLHGRGVPDKCGVPVRERGLVAWTAVLRRTYIAVAAVKGVSLGDPGTGAQWGGRRRGTRAGLDTPELLPGHLPRGHDIDGFRLWVENDARFAPLELPHDVGEFLFQREQVLAVVGPLAQHE
jgi:hypothetical protein